MSTSVPLELRNSKWRIARDPNSIERRQSYDYRPDEDAHLDPGEFSGLVSLDDLRPALPELVPPSPSLNAIEATQHRRVKDRAPNAYDQQQAAQRRASEIAMAQQQQAVMAQQTSPARVLGLCGARVDRSRAGNK